MYLSLIDYVKVFDKVRDNETLELLGNLGIFVKNITIIKNLHEIAK